VNYNHLPQNQNEARRSMSLFGTVNSKLSDNDIDGCFLEKGSHIFVSDRVSEPIALRFIDIS
jgi:hypothetical protein